VVTRGDTRWYILWFTGFRRQVCDHTSLRPESLHGHAPGRDGKQCFHLFPPRLQVGLQAWGLQRGFCVNNHGGRACVSVRAFALRGVARILDRGGGRGGDMSPSYACDR
jgi:hypothetical protein